MGFAERVYGITKRIPKGKVSTYGEVARRLNCRAYRAVGNVLNKNCDKKVPCHRVIKSTGFVGGFRHGEKKKIALLVREGIEVRVRKVDLKRFKCQDL